MCANGDNVANSEFTIILSSSFLLIILRGRRARKARKAFRESKLPYPDEGEFRISSRREEKTTMKSIMFQILRMYGYM